MFNENKNFYPTPEKLVNKMISLVDWNKVETVLEPSAGKGDIAETVKKYGEKYQGVSFDIDCIEYDENLRHILTGKDLKVVHNDFLTYDTMKSYDLIIMNPPFENGDKHILKALEMREKNGGGVICLLNAETLKNPCNNRRLSLVEKLREHGTDIEYIQNAFMEAERKTNVETALIKVLIPQTEKESFILNNLREARDKRECKPEEKDQIAENDFLKVIVEQYKMEVEAGVNLIREYQAMAPFILSRFKEGGTEDCILSLNVQSQYGKGYDLSVNRFIKEVRKKYWRALFNNNDFMGKLTGNLRREFYNKVESLGDYEFSLYNIYELKLQMNKNLIKGIEETIIAKFDDLSRKYHYLDEMSKNIHYYNGWKSNKGYYVNKKVIVPLQAWSSWGSCLYYPAASYLLDLEKCFNYLDGGLTESIDLKETLEIAEREMFTVRGK